LEKRFAKYADFVAIYIAEAHPSDGWKLVANDNMGVCYRQPKTLEQRLTIARNFVSEKQIEGKTTLVVDLIDNNTQLAYKALPERLYIVLDGVLVYVGGRGPFKYLMGEVEYWLEKQFPHAQ